MNQYFVTFFRSITATTGSRPLLVNPLLICDLVNCFDTGIFFSIVHHDYDFQKRCRRRTESHRTQLQVVTNTLISFSISEDCVSDLVCLCVASHSLYPESLPSLSCNKSASRLDADLRFKNSEENLLSIDFMIQCFDFIKSSFLWKMILTR
jgi:hypothetical protein